MPSQNRYHNTDNSKCRHDMVTSWIVGLCNDTDCTDGEIRLIGISNPLQGRVEVCSDGVWGRVCNRDWDNEDAAVACRQLGYSNSGMIELPV